MMISARLRRSEVIDRLQKNGAKIAAYDPMAMPNFENVFGNTVELSKKHPHRSQRSRLRDGMTEWDENKKLKAKDYITYMRNPTLVDARRIYKPEAFKILNYAAVGLGERQDQRSVSSAEATSAQPNQ